MREKDPLDECHIGLCSCIVTHTDPLCHSAAVGSFRVQESPMPSF
jgi:hypothetical protein